MPRSGDDGTRGTASRPRAGLSALRARVKVRGLQALDRRTAAAQALLGWRQALLADLGGEAAVSAQRMALVEAAVRTRLYLDHLDAWILEHGSLVNARRRSVHPVVRERQQLVDSLARLLSLLGLDRRPPKSVDLAVYLRERYPTHGDARSLSSPPISIPQQPASTHEGAVTEPSSAVTAGAVADPVLHADSQSEWSPTATP